MTYRERIAALSNKVLQGHALDVLKTIPSAVVQVCVTSPPYWGLRSYGTPPQIWDADESCEHQWETQQIKVDASCAARWQHEEGGEGKNRFQKSGNARTAIQAEKNWRKVPQGFCQRCSAWSGNLGLEPTLELYVKHIVDIFREVRRVLRDDGCVFLNLADSYAGSWGNSGHRPELDDGDSHQRPKTTDYIRRGGWDQRREVPPNQKVAGLKPKDLCGIPWTVALALQADGWWLRSDIIWNKLNPMPESLSGWRWERHRVKVGNSSVSKAATNRGSVDAGLSRALTNAEWQPCPGCAKCSPNDGYVLRKGSWRPTSSHEYIFMLAKSSEYFADGEVVKVPHKWDHVGAYRLGKASKNQGSVQKPVQGKGNTTGSFRAFGSGGRNLRSVWTIPTQPTPDAHFATFPERIPELCIKAGSSEKGCCPECGSPWVRVIERDLNPSKYLQNGQNRDWANVNQQTSNPQSSKSLHRQGSGVYSTSKTISWRPSCDCDVRERIPCLVLDPFMGSGTTAQVAANLSRSYLGIDLNPKYIDLSSKKTQQLSLVLL